MKVSSYKKGEYRPLPTSDQDLLIGLSINGSTAAYVGVEDIVMTYGTGGFQIVNDRKLNTWLNLFEAE